MDHFALPEDELARAQEQGTLWRDFQGYTTLRASDTVALGVSGIGFVGGAFTQNVKSLLQHAQLLGEGRLPVERGHWLTYDDRRRRDLITQLMCNFRVDLGPEAERDFGPELVRLRGLARDGLVELQGSYVLCTPLGRLFVRNVAMAFDAYLARRASAGEARPVFSRTA
jgi:oxygen-independent coproporphyrinogen-3 oxidase